MKLLLCAGTRPNFQKIAPIYHVAVKRGINVKILHTGQHYDYKMNGVFFEQLGLPNPDINLEIKAKAKGDSIKEIEEKSAEYIRKEGFDYILTVGDVDSTRGCTLGAKKAGVTVGHVEAGLRSHDNRMPEEHNRLIVDRIADLKFISEPDGIINLKLASLYSEKSCFYVGNVMIDSLVNNLDDIKNSEILTELDINPKEYCLVTIHRPSNVDEKMRLKRILKTLNNIAKEIKVILPIHPRTMKKVEEFGYTSLLENLTILEPLGYWQFLNLTMNSRFLITDSGGAQEETSYLNIPCITIRANTERPVTLLRGTSVLAGEDIRLLKYYSRLAIDGRLNRISDIELWDGRAAERIVDVLEKM